MSHKKQIDKRKVLPKQLPAGTINDGSSADLASLDLKKFQRLLAQYKAKVFERHAHLFQS